MMYYNLLSIINMVDSKQKVKEYLEVDPKQCINCAQDLEVKRDVYNWI